MAVATKSGSQTASTWRALAAQPAAGQAYWGVVEPMLRFSELVEAVAAHRRLSRAEERYRAQLHFVARAAAFVTQGQADLDDISCRLGGIWRVLDEDLGRACYSPLVREVLRDRPEGFAAALLARMDEPQRSQVNLAEG